MSAQPHACPEEWFVDRNHAGKCMGVASTSRKHDLEFVVETSDEKIATRVVGMKARIAHLEAALTRIKTLADAPDIDPCGDFRQGLHCGLEDRNINDCYDACDYGYSEGVSRTMEWAVNEAEAGLKETP